MRGQSKETHDPRVCECGHLEKDHDLYDAVTRERMDCLVGIFKGMEINAQICPCNKFCLQGRFNMIKTTAQLQQRFVEISEDNSFPKNFGTGENLIGLPPNDIYQLGFAAAFFECSRAVNQYVDAHAEQSPNIRRAAEAVVHHFYRYDNCECGVPVSLHGNLTSCCLSSNGSAELSALKGALEGK